MIATTTPTPATAPRRLTVETLTMLRRFIGPVQMAALQIAMQGEERAVFIAKLAELGEHIATMPKTYDTDGQGAQAVAQLHYFKGGCDWYITERDMGAAGDATPGAQHQAFGLAFLGDGDDCAELGYISIVELMRHNVELDLYFTPRTLADVREARA